MNTWYMLYDSSNIIPCDFNFRIRVPPSATGDRGSVWSRLYHAKLYSIRIPHGERKRNRESEGEMKGERDRGREMLAATF